LKFTKTISFVPPSWTLLYLCTKARAKVAMGMGWGQMRVRDMVYMVMSHVLGKYVSDNPYFVYPLRYAEISVLLRRHRSENKCLLTVLLLA